MEPRKDEPSVTSDWESVKPRIADVVMKRLPPVEDERGELCEIYRPAWGLHPDPVVHVYQVTVRPGRVRGWALHRLQDDRVFVSRGTLRIALFDARPESPTYRALSVFTLSERNRALIVFPRGVYHGVQNIGETEALFINLPTRPYDYANPDRYRLPLKNDLIPFAFEDRSGW